MTTAILQMAQLFPYEANLWKQNDICHGGSWKSSCWRSSVLKHWLKVPWKDYLLCTKTFTSDWQQLIQASPSLFSLQCLKHFWFLLLFIFFDWRCYNILILQDCYHPNLTLKIHSSTVNHDQSNQLLSTLLDPMLSIPTHKEMDLTELDDPARTLSSRNDRVVMGCWEKKVCHGRATNPDSQLLRASVSLYRLIVWPWSTKASHPKEEKQIY